MRRFVDEVRPRFAGGGWRGKILPGSEWAWPQGASVSRWPPRDMSMDGKTRLSRDLRIRLFGGPVLEHMGRPVDLSPFHGVLLSILAYHGRRGIRRDRLLSFLWPAGPEGALRHRLSQVVYSMHQRIGVPELVIMAGDRFFLDVDRVAPDLETFHTALQERRIDEALSLLDQEFLADVNPVPTPDLEVWIGERVRQFRADIRTAGARLWGESEQRGDWERASRTAELLLRLDPTDEELLRKVIRAHGLTGHVAEARATYREFFERMEALGADWVPAAETTGLLSRLDTLARERGPTFLLGRYGLPAQPPLVGREEELATLGQLLRDPTDGQVAGIGVVGEPGVGKTRLSWEALRSLPFDGVRVLAARCSEFERRIPLAPFTSALKPAWVGEAARDLEDPWRAVLLSIFPEWHREPGPPPVVPEIETSEVPRRLCEAFRRLFIALVRTDPVVLFIDDFHWADETSLAVLDYIRHRGVDGDLKVLVTVEDLPYGDHSLPGQRSTLGTPSGSPVLRLHNLSVKHIEDLMLAYPIGLDQAIEPIDIWAMTSGNPHHLGEVLAACSVARAKGGAGAPVQEQLSPLVGARLEALPESAQLIVMTLALSEIPIGIRHLALLSNCSTVEAACGLDRLVRMAWVAVGPEGAELVSPLLGHLLRDLFPKARATLIHKALAELLLAEASPSYAWLAIQHLLYAQEILQAKDVALSYSGQAVRAGYVREVEGTLESLLRVVPDHQSKQELAGHLARIRFARGDFPAARESFETAWKLLIRQRPGSPDAAGLELMATVSDLYAGRVEPLAAFKKVRAVEQNIAGLLSIRVVIDALTHIARVAQIREDAQTGETILAQARELLKSTDLSQSEALSLHLLLCVSIFYRHYDDALDHVHQAFALARDIQCEVSLLRAHHWHLIVLHHLGRLNMPDGLAARREAFRAAATSGHLLESTRLELNNSVWFLDCLEPEAAAVSLTKVGELLGSDPLPHLRASWLVNLGELQALEAGWAVADGQFRQALALSRTVRSHTGELLSASGLGLSLLARKQFEEAEVMYQELDSLPSWWTCDPTLVHRFLLRRGLARGQIREAVLDTEQVVEGVALRSVMWTLRLSLVLEEAKRDAGLPQDRLRLSRCEEQAQDLALTELRRRFGDLMSGQAMSRPR
jgi:DNA-binding SARP family transcriptional activator/tetratricopeptide (TPR) repeat protein